ncbi:MAG: MMPL family transporter [Chitinivibrionales bacterium]|nr:MMPL family transporter [Chitinivibrionales bacterium]
MKKVNPLAEFSVEKRVTITMFILIVVVFGLLALSKLGLDMLPDITFPMVSVVSQYPGAAPEEIEQLITAPLEGVVSGVNSVKKITSQSSEGISTILVEFEWGTNLDYAAQDIKDNIDFLRDFLPDEMTEPVIFKFNPSAFPIMIFGVSGPYNAYKITRFIEDNVQDRLQRIDGVAAAAAVGEKYREIQVACNPTRLKHRGIGITAVIQALRLQNMNTPAGYFIDNNTDYLFRAIGQFESIEDIENTIIGMSPDRTPIRLRDVARVRDTFREQRNRIRMNGRESAFLVVNKRSGANTLRVSKRVGERLDKVRELFPNMEFVEIIDQGRPVRKVTGATAWNALTGGILAITFMFMFLMNIRPTLTIAVAMPLSIITTFIALYIAGYTLNLMTLGGLALGVGMLIDNSIVVIENIYRHLEQKSLSRKDAAKHGASEVAMAIIASTMTTIVVFLPIIFSEGLASQLFRGVALTIIFSLLSSLFVALTIVPMLASVIFKERRFRETAQWFVPLRNLYATVLKWVLKHHGVTVLLVTVVLLLFGAVGGRYLGREFMPVADGNQFVLQIDLPIGTPLNETARLCGQIEEMLREYDEVETVFEIIGRSEMERGGDQAVITGPHSAQIFIRLCDAKERKHSEQDLQDIFRSRLPRLKNTSYTFMSLGMISQSEKPVNIHVLGKDLDVIEEISGNLVASISQIRGLRDIETSFSRGRPEFHFVINRQKALTFGLVPTEIQQTLEAANLGKIATQLRTGDDEIDVRVLVGKRYRDNLDEIRNIPLQTRMGTTVPLSHVVDIRETAGPTIIRHDNKMRVGVVDANLADRDLGSAIADIKTATASIQEALPQGYAIEFKGEFEDMTETFGQLLLGLLVAILLVYMVMASQFESLIHPLVIMSTMPLSIIGVVIILLITGKSLSVVAAIGIVILAGIVVNNGIVLVDYVNKLRREGMEIKDALIEAGRTRLRPVLITAGTTIFGMLPMALSRSEGSELRSPMALTVIGGLFSATFFTLFIVPVAYLYFDVFGLWLKKMMKKIIG